jgi:hypothetical protein
MAQHLLLKKFQYAIPSSALAFAMIDKKHVVSNHLPLMKVVIDFENGVLQLEGDWHFMMAVNRHNEQSWFLHHRERVKIELLIYPASPVNLADDANDGIMCPLQGSIKDGNCTGACSGLLIMDKKLTDNGINSNQWDLSFYIYDAAFDECEIKFRLPVYMPGKVN